MGNDNFTAAPSGAFRTGDGLLNIAANKQEQFEALVAAHRARRSSPPIRASPSARARKRNRAALTDELESALAAQQRAPSGRRCSTASACRPAAC